MDSVNKSTETPLGFRIALWTVVAMFLWLLLDKMLKLELHWRLLQPLTRLSIILLGFIALLAFFFWTLHKPRSGDNTEEHL